MSDLLIRELEKRAKAGDPRAVETLGAWARRQEISRSEVLGILLGVVGDKAESYFPDERRDLRTVSLRAASPELALFWGRVWIALLAAKELVDGEREADTFDGHQAALLGSSRLGPDRVIADDLEEIETSIFG